MFVIITNVCCCSEDSLLPRPAGLGLAFIAVSLSQINPHIRLEIAPSLIKKQRKIAFHTRRDSRAAK